MNSEDVKKTPVPDMVRFHEFVLQRLYAPMSDTQGSDIDMDTFLPRYEIEEGENWLRLLQKEGRSILDDTQSTQEVLDESQSSTVYPSIVALSNVGIVEAPSLDCFICIDLDGATVAVKDMRTPIISENRSSDTDISQRSLPLGLRSQLGIYRKQTGDWEVLRRRRLRILSPGDRICTSIENNKPGGLCLEYQSGERPLEAKNDILSQGLLTQPQDQDDDDDDIVGDDEKATRTQQSLTSQKLEVLDDDGDYDSDRTVCIEESNPLDSTRGVSQSSLALLGTQPDSDEETDVEESRQKSGEGRENLLQGNKYDASTADAAASSSRRRSELLIDQTCGTAPEGGSDSDDDTDVGEVGPRNDPIEERSPHEYEHSASKLGNAPDDEETCKEETNKNTSTLLSDPIEDSDDETDTKGETKVQLTNHLTTKLRHCRGNSEKFSISEKHGEASKGALNSTTETSSKMTEPCEIEPHDVQFSPSLCAETEDPPESNPKFIAQDSSPLSSPIKDATQETTSEHSVSLLSPATGMVEPTEDLKINNRKNTQKSRDIEKGKTVPPTLVMKNDREKRQTADKDNQCIVSWDGSANHFNNKSNQDTLTDPSPTDKINNNGNNKEKQKVEVRTECSRSASANAGKIQSATNLGHEERAETLRTTTSNIRPDGNNTETMEEQGGTHHTSSTSRGGAPAVSKIEDSRLPEAPSPQEEPEKDEHTKEGNGIQDSKHSPPLRLLSEHTSPNSDSPSRVSEPSKQGKSKRRRRSEMSAVEGVLEKGPKLPRLNTSLNSSREGETSNEEASEIHPETQVSLLASSKKLVVRKTRNLEISNSKPINEVSSSSETPEGMRSARKRRRASRETISCLDNEAPVRVLTTGIELTASQKSMIKRVGGVLLRTIDEAHRATHVIAGSKDRSMRRTPKLMIGLCKTNNIVDLEWLIESGRANRVMPSTEFQLLHDSQAEAQYKFEMRESLRRAGRMRSTGDSLLGGFVVCCCPGVAGNKKKGNMTPPAKEFRLIVEAAGALWAPSFAKVADFSKLIIVVSKLEDEAARQLSTKKVAEALKRGAISKSTEEIFDSIMQQQFIP